MIPNPATPAGGDSSVSLHALTARERNRLRLLAQRYRMRRDTTLRPVADVVFDLRSRHGIQLSMGQVFELLSRKAGR